MEESTLSKISFFGVFLTLVVISLGAWVRLTDAGLGCPDWPGCYGMPAQNRRGSLCSVRICLS